MSGIFPDPPDGGLPPNPNDAANPKAAYPPLILPINTAPLYYGNGCDVRLRPEVLNSLISEVEATIDQARVAYNAGSRENLELAIRYLIQRGLQTGSIANGGPKDYTVVLDPVATGFNTFMSLIVVPAMSNQADVTINMNGHGAKPLLRNDGRPLESYDFRANTPYLISWWGDAWRLVGQACSQHPMNDAGKVNIWIRTDGNDLTADGSANTPQKSFRTIYAAWMWATRRWNATAALWPQFRLGIPGTYEGAWLNGFGSLALLIGGEGAGDSPSSYRISNSNTNPGGTHGCSLVVQNAWLHLYGVTLVRDSSVGQGECLRMQGSGGGSEVALKNVIFENAVNSTTGYFMFCANSMVNVLGGSPVTFRGNGLPIGAGLYYAMNSQGGGSAGMTGVGSYFFDNCNFHLAGFMSNRVSCMTFYNTIITNSGNNVGKQYIIGNNSIVEMGGNTPPGNLPGEVWSGGIYVP